jgi:glycosyltransferase involved in cell wall biosynthesis
LKDLLGDIHSPIIVTLDTVVLPLAIPTRLLPGHGWVCASKGPHAAVMAIGCKPLSLVFHYLERRAFRRAREVWSNGKDMGAVIAGLGFHNIVVGNGVHTKEWEAQVSPPAEFQTGRPEARVASIATVLPIKGVEAAIRALAFTMKSHESCRPWQLTWVGKGDPGRYLSLAANLGVLDSVEFLGDRRDVRPYAMHSSALLCLSGGGGMSMSALEAMCSGVPVIAWDTPVYRQLIDSGRSGFLVPEGDSEELAMAVQAALSLPEEERERMAGNARRIARLHDWTAVVDRIEARLTEIRRRCQ